MLTVRCDTSCYVTGYHAPHEAGKFPSDSCFCNICFLVVSENHAIVLPSKPLIRFIGVGDDFWSITILSSLESFRFKADLSPAVTLGSFYQQTAYMAISSLGNAKAILISATGILARGKADIRSKVLCG